MGIPRLPPEIWFRVSGFLAPAELSSMSQVSKTFHEIATQEHHFQRVVSVPELPSTKSRATYRHLRALSYPPHCSTTELPNGTNMLCTVEDTLILLHKGTSRLVAFPGGQTANIEELVGDILRRRRTYYEVWFSTSLMRAHLAILPENRIAFLKGSDPAILTILNVKSWDMVKHVIPGERAPPRDVRLSVLPCIAVAGNRGEWVMYHVDNDEVVFIDWRNGTVARTVKLFPGAISHGLIFGECPATNDTSVVGVVCHKTDGSTKEVHAKGFDGVEMTFPLGDYERALFVLRSRDANTHALITESESFSCFEFVVRRKLSDSSDSERLWRGSLVTQGFPRLTENGNVLRARPPRVSGAFTFWSPRGPQQEFVVFKEDGYMQHVYAPKPTESLQVFWCKRTSEGGLAVVGKRSSGLVQVRRFENVDYPEYLPQFMETADTVEPEKAPLATWHVEELDNLSVLADHVVIAIRKDGKLEWFHFDRFCATNGTYTCPLMESLASFRFPDESGVTDSDSRADERRKT